jgi:hypothetical protein
MQMEQKGMQKYDRDVEKEINNEKGVARSVSLSV